MRQWTLSSPYLQHTQRSRCHHLCFIDRNSYNRWSQHTFLQWWLLGWKSSPMVHTILKEQLSYPGKKWGWSKVFLVVLCIQNRRSSPVSTSSRAESANCGSKAKFHPQPLSVNFFLKIWLHLLFGHLHTITVYSSSCIRDCMTHKAWNIYPFSKIWMNLSESVHHICSSEF